MSRYCLDTSAYSHLKRGDERLATLLDRAEWIGVPVVALGELRTGFRLGSRADRNEAELRTFLDNPVVSTLVVDEEVSRHYSSLVLDLRRQGTPVPTNDIWIAATAVRTGSIVLTYDRHFDRIRQAGSIILEA